MIIIIIFMIIILVTIIIIIINNNNNNNMNNNNDGNSLQGPKPAQESKAALPVRLNVHTVENIWPVRDIPQTILQTLPGDN